MDARKGSACYPQSTFYLLSDGPSIRNRRITKADFRLCSTYRSHSQAPFYLYALRLIANQAEGTIALLRYSLGICVRLGCGSLYRMESMMKGSTRSRNVSKEDPET